MNWFGRNTCRRSYLKSGGEAGARRIVQPSQTGTAGNSDKQSLPSRWKGCKQSMLSRCEGGRVESAKGKLHSRNIPSVYPLFPCRRSLSAFLAVISCSVARKTIPSMMRFRWCSSSSFCSDFSRNCCLDLMLSTQDCSCDDDSDSSLP